MGDDRKHSLHLQTWFRIVMTPVAVGFTLVPLFAPLPFGEALSTEELADRAAFVLVGLGLLGYLWRRTIVDRKARTVDLWLLGIPVLLARRMPLDRFVGVSTRSYRVKRGKKYRTKWKVVLVGEEEIDVVIGYGSSESAEHRRKLEEWIGPPFDGPERVARLDLELTSGSGNLRKIGGVLLIFPGFITLLSAQYAASTASFWGCLIGGAVAMLVAIWLLLPAPLVVIGFVSRTIHRRPLGRSMPGLWRIPLAEFTGLEVRAPGVVVLAGPRRQIVVSPKFSSEIAAGAELRRIAQRIGPPFDNQGVTAPAGAPAPAGFA